MPLLTLRTAPSGRAGRLLRQNGRYCRKWVAARSPLTGLGAAGPATHVMLRRLTDDVICERLGKRPLEVAADRSARAAHAACGFWTSSDNLWLNLWLQIRLCAPLVGTVDWDRSRCSLRSHVSRWACRKAAVRCLGLDSLESPRNQRHSPQGRVGQEARLENDLRETHTALLQAAG